MTPEGKLRKQLRDACHDRGWGCHPLQHPSLRGWPDVRVMLPGGVAFEAELKAPTTRHSPKHLEEQAAVRQMLRENGYPAILLTSADDIEAFIAALDVLFIILAK